MEFVLFFCLLLVEGKFSLFVFKKHLERENNLSGSLTMTDFIRPHSL